MNKLQKELREKEKVNKSFDSLNASMEKSFRQMLEDEAQGDQSLE